MARYLQYLGHGVAASLCAYLGLVFLPAALLSVPVLVAIFAEFLLPPRLSWFWVVVVGIIYASSLPYPSLAYLGAFLAVVILLRVLGRYYVAQRTFFGMVVSGLCGALILELGLYGLGQIPGIADQGWASLFNGNYLLAAIRQSLGSALMAGIIFLLLRRLLPQTRGVLMESSARFIMH